MPRRAKVQRRGISPHSRDGGGLFAPFINKGMMRGEKNGGGRIGFCVIRIIRTRTNRDPLDVFQQAIHNATPLVEVKPRRVGGATYQVPVQIEPGRRLSLAIRWLLQSARSRSGHSMAEKLAGELMDAANNTGATIKRREDTHRMAEANRAFSHYRW